MNVNDMDISGETALRICTTHLYHPRSGTLSIKTQSKGKKVVHLTQDELESGSDSEQTVVGLVTSHLLSAVLLWNL